jgi:hypothetical protein
MSKSMREHTIATHVHEADHSVKMAKQCKDASSHFRKLDELEKAKGGMEENQTGTFGMIADHFDQMSDDWTDRADFHLQCCDDLGKATDADDLTKADLDRFSGIRSDGIFGIVPELPQGIRPIPRAGQREVFGKASDGMDAALAKVIGVSEEN